MMRPVGSISLPVRLAAHDEAPPRPGACPTCNGIGFERVTGGVRYCACRRSKIRESKLDAIPPLFQDADFATFTPRSGSQRAAFEVMTAQPGGSYYLHGHCGSGKTHLLMAHYRALVLAGVPPCQLWTIAPLLREMREIEMNSEYVSALWDAVHFGTRFHLLIDDIDKFHPTGFRGQVLHELIDVMYKRKMAITVTSNLGLRDVQSVLGPAVVRRLDEMCKVLKVE